MPSSANQLFLPCLLVCLTLAGCKTDKDPATVEAEDPAEIAIGERLFLETRFAQFFAVNAADVNTPPVAGDPTMDSTQTITADLPGPFAGQSMNCAACHLVDQQLAELNGGMRTYNDFARRSPIPDRSDRGDTRTTAVRNAQPLVGTAVARNAGLLFHFDGEFVTLEDLVRATLTGRNYGWLPDEEAQAIAQVATVIRHDDGHNELGEEFGGSYTKVLTGTAGDLPGTLVLPAAYRVDVATATDQELFDAVAKLIAAYVEGLAFGTGENGVFNLSPYDAFLAANGLPQQPNAGESDIAYATRLRTALDGLVSPVFILDDGDQQTFHFHGQAFDFGEQELRGLKVFLRRQPGGVPLTAGVGNCVACHAPPHFTDFKVHNTGVTQREYDTLHGDGGFAALAIPALAARNADYNAFLPATPAHPLASERFRAVADAGDASLADLGVWNVFANPDLPASQARLRGFLCDVVPGTDCGVATDDTLLTRAIASFKTPILRDLGHSGPYMHNGAFDTLEDSIRFYQDVSGLARNATLRNADPRLADIALDEDDIADLTAFLKALNEDYE